jgi:hypothetical protein
MMPRIGIKLSTATTAGIANSPRNSALRSITRPS